MIGKMSMMRLKSLRSVSACNHKLGRAASFGPRFSSSALSNFRSVGRSDRVVSTRISTMRGFHATNRVVEGEKNGMSAASEGKSLAEFDYDDYDDFDEQPQTAAGKVRMWGRALFQLTLVSGLAFFIYYIGKEMIPTKLSPNTMFGNSSDLLRTNAELQKMIGEDMKAYGRVGGSKALDSLSYTHTDGSERTRIRYTVEGRRGKAMVWCEMSDNLEDTEEYVYLICQHLQTGRVLTLHDNRSRLDEMAAKGGSVKSKDKGLIAEILNMFK